MKRAYRMLEKLLPMPKKRRQSRRSNGHNVSKPASDHLTSENPDQIVKSVSRKRKHQLTHTKIIFSTRNHDEDYNRLMEKMIFVVKCAADTIANSLKKLEDALRKEFPENETRISVCLCKMTAYIKVCHMCDMLHTVLKSAQYDQDAISTGRPFHEILPHIQMTFDHYYRTYEAQVVMPPAPFPPGNINIRKLLKRLSELPYLLHRDIYTLLDRFRVANNCSNCPGIKTLFDCFGSLLDVYCGDIREELDIDNYNFEIRSLSNSEGSKRSKSSSPSIPKSRQNFVHLLTI
ncbi:hypothetical protein ACOME3_002873 [Neoechinorhynchus agilis]